MNNSFKPGGKNPQGPKPSHRFPIKPKFSAARTVRADYHLGAIARYIHDYAQDERGKYAAAIVVIAAWKFIIQIGVTINRGKPDYLKEIYGAKK